MTHCSDGLALDKFDALTALVDWVEKGKAPDRIIATVDPANKEIPGVLEREPRPPAVPVAEIRALHRRRPGSQRPRSNARRRSLERSDFGLNRVGDSRIVFVVIQTPGWVEVSRRCRSLFLKICATA